MFTCILHSRLEEVSVGACFVQKTNEELRAKIESGSAGQNAQARLRDREGYIASLQVHNGLLSRVSEECCSVF